MKDTSSVRTMPITVSTMTPLKTSVVPRADELADDRADEREAYVEPQRGEEIGQRVRYAQVPEDVALRRVDAMEELERRRVHRAHTGDAVHQDREKGRESGDDRLRHDRESEPDDEDRRDRDERRRADRHDDRVERLLRESRVDHHDGEDEADDRAHDEAEHRFLERDERVVQNALGGRADVRRRDESGGDQLYERADDRRGRGEQVDRDTQQIDDPLPQ